MGMVMGGVQPLAAVRAVLARDLVRGREQLGWSLADLVRRAELRVETPCRIETGKHTPSLVTIEKIDGAFRERQRGKGGQETGYDPHVC